ncbi:hypothetical protein ABIE37_000343 [Arthrobacter bambusae]|uniref:Uncharacterized protein n=1 Tax=Arthrobacter bambusae TaxID=1338426 RepID=A0ABV2P1I1_9MICC
MAWCLVAHEEDCRSVILVPSSEMFSIRFQGIWPIWTTFGAGWSVFWKGTAPSFVVVTLYAGQDDLHSVVDYFDQFRA